eukprot:TRINITY_DN5745_c0_g1_i2.p1 TRINITY_DN5745_c0_g1~~TRINITY_DN5745_c0_g1_i2.p1  ORF type:complete len:381 (+),score=23.07 TRINITY_DN5745_c0_g1_i2:364-1506(+)
MAVFIIEWRVMRRYGGGGGAYDEIPGAEDANNAKGALYDDVDEELKEYPINSISYPYDRRASKCSSNVYKRPAYHVASRPNSSPSTSYLSHVGAIFSTKDNGAREKSYSADRRRVGTATSLRSMGTTSRLGSFVSQHDDVLLSVGTTTSGTPSNNNIVLPSPRYSNHMGGSHQRSGGVSASINNLVTQPFFEAGRDKSGDTCPDDSSVIGVEGRAACYHTPAQSCGNILMNTMMSSGYFDNNFMFRDDVKSSLYQNNSRVAGNNNQNTTTARTPHVNTISIPSLHGSSFAGIGVSNTNTMMLLMTTHLKDDDRPTTSSSGSTTGTNPTTARQIKPLRPPTVGAGACAFGDSQRVGGGDTSVANLSGSSSQLYETSIESKV